MTDPPAITADLAALLATVDRSGDFATAGTAELLAPSLRVDGIGPIALPLLSVQAEQLIASAEPAPYGKGEQTLVDTAVRRTWQIGPDRVHIAGRHWPRTLDIIIAQAAAGLGVSEPIDAQLYKLLIYDKGSFFIGHRDTEKAPGMFATLVIVLPSISQGGELLVRHTGREMRFDLQCEDPSEVAFAAFYADCVHEVLPVTTGCRLTLVYNLLRRAGEALQPPSYRREQARVTALLQAWSAGKTTPNGEAPSDGGTPEKLVYLLEHAYTPAELGFASLKGADAAIAGVLAAAAPAAGCDLHLALLTIEEFGIAEYADRPSRGHWSGRQVDEFEAGEVTERLVGLSEWRTAGDGPAILDDMPVLDEELSPPGALDDIEADEEHFREATGNEGASFERTYRRAALVLWARDRKFAVLSQAGRTVTVPHLEDMAQRWAGATDPDKATLWQEAHALAGHMIEQWPSHTWGPRHESAPSLAARTLAALTQLADSDRIATFVTQVTASGDYGASDNETILAALGCLPAARQTALLELIIERAVATSFGACADLLVRANGKLPDLHGAAARMVEAMPGDPARFVPQFPWQRQPEVEAGFVADLLTALVAIDQAEAERAVAYILAWPKVYDLDRVVLPALRKLPPSIAGGAALLALRATCLEHLRARIAQPLSPPADWRRENLVSCTCQHCREFGRFLADPAQKLWLPRAAETQRAHVAATVRTSHADVDTTTDRRGRPYSLVCSKNQASYDRRAKQRAQDLDDVALLGG